MSTPLYKTLAAELLVGKNAGWPGFSAAGARRDGKLPQRLPALSGRDDFVEDPAMLSKQIDELPPEARRKEIFFALVEAQDQDVGVVRSRQVVAQRFGVSEQQVRQIEQEGLDHEWPPL
jgi:hypothetical protein